VRHLWSPEEDPKYVGDIRLRNMIVERTVNSDHLMTFGIIPLIQSVGWDNILDWGRPTYCSIAQTMFTCISDFSIENLTFIITTREGRIEVDCHLISGLMDIPVNDDGIPIHMLVEEPSEYEKRMLTRVLCNMDAEWSSRNELASNV
jgi:hypothetical protein